MPITKMEEPSLIQVADPETAHREQQYPHQGQQQQQSPSTQTKHSHAQHHNIHNRRLRGRQADGISSGAAPSSIPPEVVEVIQTISIIQQVNVDAEGNTVGMTTYTTSSEPLTSAAIIASLPMSSSAISDIIATSSVVVSEELPAETGSVIPTASAEPVPTTSDPPALETPPALPATVSAPETFAYLIPSINATIIVSSSSHTTFLSSTTSAASSSSGSATSSTTISSTTSGTSIESLLSSLLSTNTNSFTLNAEFGSSSSSIETTSASSSLPYASSQVAPSTTGAGGVIAGGEFGATNTPLSGEAGSSNDASGDPSDRPAPLTPPKVAGVVVGSLAGLAALVILAFYILRHVKQKRGGAVRLSASSLSPGLIGGASSGSPMSEKQSRFLPIYNAFRSKPKELASSEAGEVNKPSFVRISGRKLPSVLQHGGDGYGGPGEVPPIPQHLSQHLSDASFYADDTGYHGGTGDKGVSTAISGGALAATATGQRGRNHAPSAQNQPGTPNRSMVSQNPFSSPNDSIMFTPKSHDSDPTTGESIDEYTGTFQRSRGFPQDLMKDGAQKSAIVSHAGPPIKRNKSHNVQLSSNTSSSPEQPHTGNTESSGSTNYQDARDYESLARMVLKRPDPLGRSHPSQDGSKGSRFREDV